MRKTGLYMLMLLILAGSLTGCIKNKPLKDIGLEDNKQQANKDNEAANDNEAIWDDNIEDQFFLAEIIESDGTLLVTPDKETAEYLSSDKISVAVREAEIIDDEGNVLDIDMLKPGDKVRIFYNGIIAESYPAQISADKVVLIGPSDNGKEKEDELLDKAPKELDELEGVWIETEYEAYETGVTEVRVKWYNTLNDDMMFGEYFILEENDNGTWKSVSKETDINYGFNDIGYGLTSNEARWHTYYLIPYTDGLSPGDYRISATFTRTTLDGNDYSAGNYPEYRVYGYFTVGDKMIRRDLSFIDDTMIEYLNDEYNFGIYLQKEWEGLKVSTSQETGDKDLDELFKKIDEEFIVMNIRHPKWTNEEPYQDISIAIFRAKEWNENVANAVEDDFNLLPLSIPGGGYEYVLRSNPVAYKSYLKGYSQVLEIIGDGNFSSLVHAY